MTEDRRSQSELDVGAALDAVEKAAQFVADELLNCVLITKELPTDIRMGAFQDAAGLLHHSYNATRPVRWAFDHRNEWPNLSGDPSQIALATPQVTRDAIEAMKKAKGHLEQCLPIFVFEAADDPAHWSKIDLIKYETVSRRIHDALQKVNLAIESLTHLD